MEGCLSLVAGRASQAFVISYDVISTTSSSLKTIPSGEGMGVQPAFGWLRALWAHGSYITLVERSPKGAK